jgi:hypothetical protein
MIVGFIEFEKINNKLVKIAVSGNFHFAETLSGVFFWNTIVRHVVLKNILSGLK